MELLEVHLLEELRYTECGKKYPPLNFWKFLEIIYQDWLGISRRNCTHLCSHHLQGKIFECAKIARWQCCGADNLKIVFDF